MSLMSRRSFIATTAAGTALAGSFGLSSTDAKAPRLASLTNAAQPITPAEHGARLVKLQLLMQQRRFGALLIEAGSSLEYFTGVRWWRSERTTAALIPATGGIVIVTPFFEEPSVRETLKVPADVRPWKEDQSPFELIAAALRERAGPGPLAVEGTTRFFIVNRIVQAATAAPVVVPGDEIVHACRGVKSRAELALMQAANDVTLAALKQLHGRVEVGMQGRDIVKLLAETTEALGGKHEFSLVLLNEASAYPHGSEKTQTVRSGSTVLIDSGCSVYGYQSDISRTWVFGEPSVRQREVWDTVKRGQEIALETAKIGVPAGAIDKAVRRHYEGEGWSKDYGLPGTSHRTGHGIGMDGHEPPYLVRSEVTPLVAGMCFSDEPGIYIPGEFGVRLEDCWYMTDDGPKLFTALAASIEQPI